MCKPALTGYRFSKQENKFPNVKNNFSKHKNKSDAQESYLPHPPAKRSVPLHLFFPASSRLI